MQKLYTLTSDEVESLSFYQQSIRTTASYIGKLIDKIEDGETHTEKIKYKLDEIISYTKHINDILAEKWNNDLLRKVRKTSMKHLVIFYTENGIYSAVYNFKNIPPTTEDIKEMQKDIQKTESLIQIPAVVNWLPISD